MSVTLRDFLLGLKPSKAIILSLIIISAISPSMVFIFFFAIDLFLKIDTIKLILICTSVGAPFIIYTYFI